MKPKFQVKDFIRVADLNKAFSKFDMTNWSNKLDRVTELNIDKISSYRVDILPKQNNQSLLKKTKLTLRENYSVMKALNLN